MSKYNSNWHNMPSSITISSINSAPPTQWVLTVPNAWSGIVGSRFAKTRQDIDSEIRTLEMKVDLSGLCDAKEVLSRIMK